MDKRDIEKLFLSVLENSEQDTDAVRRVFSILVGSTLEYRDHILASKGIIVTVEDVYASLDGLVYAIETGLMPEEENEIRLDLLKTWLRELG